MTRIGFLKGYNMQSLLSVYQQIQQSRHMASSVSVHKTLAENIFKDLQSCGLKEKDIIAVSSELIAHLTSEIQNKLTSSQVSDNN